MMHLCVMMIDRYDQQHILVTMMVTLDPSACVRHQVSQALYWKTQVLPPPKEGQSLALQVLCTMEDVLNDGALLRRRNLMGKESIA